jgi:hypothetical protein
MLKIKGMRNWNLFIEISIVILALFGCKKEDKPKELTVNLQVIVSNVEFDQVAIRCCINMSGGEQQEISKFGLCYSMTNNNPTIENSNVIEIDYNPDTQCYSSIVDMPNNTSFHACAYAVVSPQRSIDKPIYYSDIETVTTSDIPSITDVYPLKGYFMDTISIKGAGFSWNMEENRIFFNDVEATFFRENNDLKAFVPRKAGKGKIKLQVRKTIIEGPEFDFLQDEYDVYTLSGKSESGFADGNQSDALFNNPHQLILDRSGNLLIADRGNHRIRKITPDGTVTTLAGSGSAGYADGPAASARFNEPVCLAVHPVTGDIYVTEAGSHCIRKISADGTTVSTFKGIANKAGNKDGSFDMDDITFNHPKGIAFNSKNELFVADQDNNCVRKISSTGTTTTFAGYGDATYREGQGINASIWSPWPVYIDKNDYVYTFSRITGYSGLFVKMLVISPAANVKMYGVNDFSEMPGNMVQDDELFFYFPVYYMLDRVSITGGRSFAGIALHPRLQLDGPKTKAKFIQMNGIEMESNQKIFVSDVHSIRVIEKMK